jgi:hypothetical protein
MSSNNTACLSSLFQIEKVSTCSSRLRFNDNGCDLCLHCALFRLPSSREGHSLSPTSEHNKSYKITRVKG